MTLKRFPAELEYKKSQELSKETVQQIMNWIQMQPHLPNISEEEVILFLSSCNYSAEQAKQTLDLYYTIRTHVPEFFDNRDPLEEHNAQNLKIACIVPMQGTTDEGYKVLYCKLMDPDITHYTFNANIKCIFMCQDFMLAEEGSHSGVHFVFDLEKMSFGHMTKINPFAMKKALFYLQEAMPVRIRGFHFINPVSFMDRLLGMVRPLLNKSTSEVLVVHNSLGDLHKSIPKRLLPKDAGGQQASTNVLHDDFLKKIVDHRVWFIEEEKLRVQESQRPGKAKNAGDLFGVEGTFKKLDID